MCWATGAVEGERSVGVWARKVGRGVVGSKHAEEHGGVWWCRAGEDHAFNMSHCLHHQPEELALLANETRTRSSRTPPYTPMNHHTHHPIITTYH